MTNSPSIDSSSEWTDEVLPSATEFVDPETKTKTITEYVIRDDKKVKVVKTFNLEVVKVPACVSKRKNWTKYGAAYGQGPGPKSSDIQCDDIFMQFIQSKELTVDDVDDNPLAKLKGQKLVTCRICKGDHWTTKCPYKDSLNPPNAEDGEGEKNIDNIDSADLDSMKPILGKYVPPSKREGARSSGITDQKRDDVSTIRVTNLPEETTESDLQNLFKESGHIARIYLAKDKITNISKGFAFINYANRESAVKAIEKINGHGYGHLILNVEWARPSAHP